MAKSTGSLHGCFKIHNCPESIQKRVLEFKIDHEADKNNTAIDVNRNSIENAIEYYQDISDKAYAQVDKSLAKNYDFDTANIIRKFAVYDIDIDRLVGKTNKQLKSMFRAAQYSDQVKKEEQQVANGEPVTRMTTDKIADLYQGEEDFAGRGSAANGIDPKTVKSKQENILTKAEIDTIDQGGKVPINFEEGLYDQEQPVTSDQEDEVRAANSENEKYRQKRSKGEDLLQENETDEPNLKGLVSKEVTDSDNEVATAVKRAGTSAAAIKFLNYVSHGDTGTMEEDEDLSQGERDVKTEQKRQSILDSKFRPVKTFEQKYKIKDEDQDDDRGADYKAKSLTEFRADNKEAIIKMYNGLANITSLVSKTDNPDTLESLRAIQSGNVKTGRDYIIYQMMEMISQYDLHALTTFILKEAGVNSIQKLKEADSFDAFNDFLDFMNRQFVAKAPVDPMSSFHINVTETIKTLDMEAKEDLKDNINLFKFLFRDQGKVYDFYKWAQEEADNKEEIIARMEKKFKVVFSDKVYSTVGKLFDQGIIEPNSTKIVSSLLTPETPAERNADGFFKPIQKQTSFLFDYKTKDIWEKIVKNVRLNTIAKKNFRGLINTLKNIAIQDDNNSFSVELSKKNGLVLEKAFKKSKEDGSTKLLELLASDDVRQDMFEKQTDKLDELIYKVEQETKLEGLLPSTYKFKQLDNGKYKFTYGTAGTEITLNHLVKSMSVESEIGAIDRNITSGFSGLTTNEKKQVVLSMLSSLNLVDNSWEHDAPYIFMLGEQIEGLRESRYEDLPLSEVRQSKKPINTMSVINDALRSYPYEFANDVETILDMIETQDIYTDMATEAFIAKKLKYSKDKWVVDYATKLKVEMNQLFQDGFVGKGKKLIKDNDAKNLLIMKLLDARVIMAQKNFERSNILRSDAFEKLEGRDGAEANWKANDFYNAYVNSGMDYVRFKNAIEARKQQVEQAKMDVLYADPKINRDKIILEYLGEELFKKFKAIHVDTLVLDKDSKTKDQLFQQLTTNEKRQINAAYHLHTYLEEQDLAQINIADIKVEDTKISDIFAGKRIRTAVKEAVDSGLKRQKHEDDPSEPYRGILRNKEAQRFYELVARQFGTRLVIISTKDPKHKTRYDATNATDPKIVINIQDDPSFHHVFSHELWHHIVNQAPKAQYDAFVKSLRQIAKTPDMANIIANTKRSTKINTGIDTGVEEVTAEVFATVLGQKAFYEQLAGSLQGQMIGRGLVQRLVEHVSKLPAVIDHTTMMHEGLMLFDTREMQQVYSLVNDMVASGMEKGEQTLNHSEIRYNTLLGSRTLSEIKGYLDNPKKWLQGVWKKIVPPGSKNYKDIMVAIEKILSNTREWIKNNKPQTVYADFMAEKKAQEIASIIQHGYEQLGQEANARIVDKHDGIYNNMTEPQMRTLHDRVVRGLNGAGTQVGGLDFKKASDIEIGLKQGISREIIDAFITYQDIADTIHKELRKSFPDLPYVATHYGQSLMWMRKDKTPDQEATNAILYSDESVLDGQKRFLQSKDFTRTTAQIARESGLTPKNLNPTLVLLNYVEEASKLIYTKKMMNAALLANHGKLFTSAAAAEKEGFINNLDDEAFEVFMPRDNEVGYTVSINGSVQEENGRRVVYSTEQDAIDAAKDLGTEENVATVNSILKDAEKASISWTVYGTDKNGKKAYVRGALNKETAKTNLDHFTKEYPDVSFSIEREFVSRTQKTAVSKMYFKKDLHKLLDVALRKDRFREGKLLGVSGRSLLNLKNMMTSIEFAVSLFHASTIMQELVASEMTLKQQKAVGVVGVIKSLNPISAVSGGVRDAKKIKAVFNAIAQNNEVAKDPKVIKLVEEILGTSDVNVWEMYKNFINVGGRMHMDASERSSVYGYGKMKYGSVKKKLVIGDDEATIEGRIAGDNVLERSVNTIKDTAKEFSNSVKGVHEQQLALHPDKEVQALLKTVVFTGLQSTTAWLMEDAIPMIKLSIWAKQYAHNVSKYNSEIVADKKSTHSIAHDTMKFVEDKFGEVNWKSQWMDPTYKSALIFTFRSFTWFTGSWKALGKGGLDVGRKVWYTAKGEDYQLTEKGLWLFNVHMAHAMTSATMHLMYAMMAGDDEVPTDEDTTLLNKIMFPRVDDQDPNARLTIPGYSTEINKVFHHVGLIGEDFDPLALVRGRFNTLITNAVDVVSGTDWRGVEIRHEEDMLATKFVDSITHLFSVAPISLSTMYGDFKRKGFDGQKMAFALAGGTSAPAYSKHSNAVNLAYKMRREQYSETGVTDVEMKQRESTSKAAYQYASGNRKPLMDMLFAGEISTDEYSNALKKQPRIDGVPNPQYKEELVRALGSLPIEKALTVWTKMTDGEKERMRPVIYKKYRNAIKPNNHKRTQKEKTSIKNTMYKYGVLG